jgi:hypothetical protein
MGLLAPLALTTALALAPTGAAGAQPPQRPPGARGAAVATPGELADLLDTYVIVQAQRALQLDDEQYARFVPAVKKLQAVRRRTQRERLRLIQELRRLAGPQVAAPAADDVIRAQLGALRQHDEAAAVEVRGAYDAVDQVLEPAQQARFRILEETIERRKLELLMRARDRAGTGRGER